MKIFLAAAKAARDAEDEDEDALLWFATIPLAGKGSGFFHIADGQNEGNGTALHQAATDVAPEAVQHLLQARAEVNAVGGEVETPLWLAAVAACSADPTEYPSGTPRQDPRRGSVELMELLLKARADPRAPYHAYRTPLDLVKERYGIHGLLLLGRFGLATLVASEGPEAVEALEDWKEVAKDAHTEPMQRAHLRQRLRAVLAPGRVVGGKWCLAAGERYGNLKSQNVIAMAEVLASLWYLPGLSAADACDEELLQALVSTTNEDVFQTDTVQAVVQAAWAQMRFSTAWEVFSCLLMVVLLCVASCTFRHELPQAAASRRYMSTVCIGLLLFSFVFVKASADTLLSGRHAFTASTLECIRLGGRGGSP